MSQPGTMIIKGLPESHEIHDSYSRGEYFDAVLKCRVFLESWLAEYIFALLFPDKKAATRENREFVNDRFSDMFYQIIWLKDEGHISQSVYEQLNQIRKLSDRILQKGDVLKVCSKSELNRFIVACIEFCRKFKGLTEQAIKRGLDADFR